MQPIHHGSVHHAGVTPVGGAQAAGKAVGGGAANSSTTVSNIGELQSKAPEFVEGMLKTLAQNIMRMQDRSQNRIKEILRKDRQG